MPIPVLIVFFNRPDALSKLLARVLEAEPSAVYLACDGPRQGREDDRAAVAECRTLARSAPWRRAVHERFLDSNLGCGRAVSSAVDWFFSRVPEGVVLEDDCLPGRDFIPFCAEVLARHRVDERVMSVNGTNLRAPRKPGAPTESYSFCRQPMVWGWASWARAWSRYRFSIDRASIRALPRESFPLRRRHSVALWRRKFDRVSRGRIDTWDFQWAFAHFLHRGLVVSPSVNLVTNVTTASGAHSDGTTGPWQDFPAAELSWPIRHPDSLELDGDMVEFIDEVVHNHRPYFPRKAWKLAQRMGLVSLQQIRSGSILRPPASEAWPA